MLQPVKRVEIVIDGLHLPRVLKQIREAGADSYTVFHDVEGRGDRGEQRADEVSGASTNAYILIAIEATRASAIAKAIRPLLRSYGGMCVVSDAQWLDH